MLDIKRIRSNPEEVVKALEKRHGDFPIQEVLKLDEERRELIGRVESMKAEQNATSKKVPEMKKNGEDPSDLFKKMKELSDDIKSLDEKVKDIDANINELLLEIPNTPNDLVEVGETDDDNTVIRTWGEPRVFDFEPKAHWDLGTNLDVLDFERATKIAKSRFSIFKKKGATLERSIINFMLDLHTREHHYDELNVPILINRKAMKGTGQLPKFKEDMFHCEADNLFLAPTAEVPVTNIYDDEILDYDILPIYHTAYTPCFRREAGSAGRDTRGLIRNHQFDKVEMVKFVKPETSYDELETLTDNAEEILRLLEIPHRVVRLCTGDLGFSSAMTYDVEVWMPSYNRYVEISSCSNFEDFQARRGNIKFRNENGKAQYVHTLNGSGLAVGRTFAAILENYQNEDRSVEIPKILQDYTGFDKLTK